MAYVYRITHKETGEFYIGFNSGNRTIGKDYFTSSQYVTYSKETVKEWHTHIIWIGEHDECYRKEQEWIAENFDNPLNLNRRYANPGAQPTYKVTPEFIEIMTEVNTAKWQDPEYRQKQTEARRKIGANPEFRAKMSEIQKQKAQDPEYRQMLSDRGKERYSNPEERRRQSEKMKALCNTPEAKAAYSARNKKSWEIEGRREEMSKRVRDRLAQQMAADSEAERARRSELAKLANDKRWAAHRQAKIDNPPPAGPTRSEAAKARWAKWRAEKDKNNG